MSKTKISTEEAKQIIQERIGSNIEFRILRKELKGMARRSIKLMVLELMDELKLSEVPFPGMMRKPNKAIQPLLISPEGMIDVKEILEKKELNPDKCVVKYNIGKSKISMIIKEKKDHVRKIEE